MWLPVSLRILLSGPTVSRSPPWTAGAARGAGRAGAAAAGVAGAAAGAAGAGAAGAGAGAGEAVAAAGAGAAAGCGRCRRCGRCSCGRVAADLVDVVEDVVTGDPSTRARADDVVDVQRMVRDEPADDRRQEPVVTTRATVVRRSAALAARPLPRVVQRPEMPPPRRARQPGSARTSAPEPLPGQARRPAPPQGAARCRMFPDATGAAAAAGAGGGCLGGSGCGGRIGRRLGSTADDRDHGADRDRVALLGEDLRRRSRRSATGPRCRPCRCSPRTAARRPRSCHRPS